MSNRLAVSSRLEVFYTGGAVALSRDASCFACACGDETTLVEAASGRVLHRLAGDTEPVTALCFTPCGSRVFIASRSLMVRVHAVPGTSMRDGEGTMTGRGGGDGGDVGNGDEAGRPFCRGHTAPVICMIVDDENTLLATASADRTVRVWDIEGGYCTHSLKGHSGMVLDAVFTAADTAGVVREVVNALITSDDEGEIRIWSLDTRSCMRVLKGHYSAVPSICISRSTGTLLSAGRDKIVNVWDISQASFESGPGKKGTSAANKKKKRRKDTGGSDDDGDGDKAMEALKTIPIFESIECIREVQSDMMDCLGPSPSSSSSAQRRGATDGVSGAALVKDVRFVTAGEKGVLRFWRADSDKPLYETAPSLLGPEGSKGVSNIFVNDTPEDVEAMTHGEDRESCSPPNMFCVMADSRILALSSHDDSSQLDLQYHLVGNHDELVDLCYIWHGDAQEEPFIAMATNSNDIFIYDAISKRCMSVLRGHTDIVLAIDVIPRGAGDPTAEPLLLSGSKDNTIRLWRINAKGVGTCVASGLGHIAPVSAVAFAKRAPCAFFLTGGDDKLLKKWDLPNSLGLNSGGSDSVVQLTVRSAVSAHEKDINAIAVSPNNALICSGSLDRTAKVWSAKDMRSVFVLKGHKRGIWSVQFSPVDKIVMTASADTTIRLWDLNDGSCVRVLEGHTSSVLRVQFLSAGARIVSGGGDGLVKLWAVQSGECINTFDEHEDKVWAVAVNKKDNQVISGGADATTVFWNDVSSEDRAEEVTRNAKLLVDAQRLSELMRHQNYDEAMKLGLSLGHPRSLLKVITAHVDDLRGGTALEDDPTLPAMIRAIKSDAASVKKLLGYVREWNTNAKLCVAAQAMLHALFREIPHYELVKMGGVRASLEALAPYTQRHFSRMDRLLKSTFTLDYTMKMAKLLEPDGSVLDALLPSGARRTKSKPKATKSGGKRSRASDGDGDGKGDVDDEEEDEAVEDRIYEFDEAALKQWQKRQRDKERSGTEANGGDHDDEDDDDDDDDDLDDDIDDEMDAEE